MEFLKGIQYLEEALMSFGLGNYLGYDLALGKKGLFLMPHITTIGIKKEDGSLQTVVSNAIGQGEILTTPIQMANFTATIANRGFFIKPHFQNQ